MQRIQTPSAVAEMFIDGPPNATHYSAIWSNNVQESLARPLVQQAIVLDGANFDQWTLMLQSYRYLAGGMPTVEGGAQFRVLTGGFFTIATGGTFQVDSGATVVLSDGSTVNLLGDLTIGTDNTNVLAVNSSITTVLLANLGITGAFGGNPVDLPEGATVAAGKTVTLTGNADVVGGVGSVVDVEILEQTTQRFDDSVTVLPSDVRDMHWLETIQAVRMPDGGAGTVRAVAIPATGTIVAFATAAAIEDTGAFATFRAFEDEPLLVTVKFGYRHTAAPATGQMHTRIQFQGPTDEDEFIETWDLVSGAGWLPFAQDYAWTPTDTFITPGTRNYDALLRVGSGLGADLEIRNITVQVRSTFVV